MSRQTEFVPLKYGLRETGSSSGSPATVSLRSGAAAGNPFYFTLEAVRPGIFRTTFTSQTHPLPPFPSAARLKPNFDGVNAVTPTVCMNFKASCSSMYIGNIKAVVEWTASPRVSLFRDGESEPVYTDLAYRSYAVDGPGVAHYSCYKKDGVYVGLGEKAAPMNLAGRSFKITASDTFGYDAYRTDPLYKHIPLLLHLTPTAAVGIFSTSHARSTWDVGSEIDGLWGRYKVHRQTNGGLEEYLFVGKSAAEVVRLYADVVGYPMLVPRYMMGYTGGGMKYSMEDEPPASDAIMGFIRNCEKHDVPVSAFQMSSGYTISDQEPRTRNVFTWNRHRFSDPRQFTAMVHKHGVRLLANIKPYILDSHPSYQTLVRNGALFTDPSTGKHGVARLWSAGGGESGEGAHVDFTSNFGYQWWHDGCKALKDVGIDALWNDNNEYNIPNDEWELALENVPVPEGLSSKAIGLWGRAIHTELMNNCSHDTLLDAEPDDRPLVLTRSATAGTMRYACSSWSGDNVTSWEGMKGSNAISLNASFSLLHCFGHDIGGFEGPQPTPELLVRWVQLGVHQPRFAINCYKTSKEDNLVGAVIEPWQYPLTTPLVREAVKRRYELIPYVYSQVLQSHLTALPPMRWTGWGYESDSAVWTKQLLEGDTQFWCGDTLLVSAVYEPGESKARIYLPIKSGDSALAGSSTAYGFVNTNAPFQWLASGEWHEIGSPWFTSIPVLARVGGIVPVGKRYNTTSRIGKPAEETEFPSIAHDDWRGAEVFPPPILAYNQAGEAVKASFTGTWLEDDGISGQGRSPIYELRLTYAVESATSPIIVQVEAGIKLAATISGAAQWSPLWLDNGLDIILPVGEDRAVKTTGVQKATEKGQDAKGRLVWNVTVAKV